MCSFLGFRRFQRKSVCAANACPACVLVWKVTSTLYTIHPILAAPTCTEFSIAKGSKPRDFKNAITIVEACLKIIWKCRIERKLKFWALENPVGFLRQFLGIPKYQFEHWQFGNFEFIKRTDIWGYFKESRITVKEKPAIVDSMYETRINGRGMSRLSCPEEYKHLNLNKSAIRAITPSGFANAFYNAHK